MLEYQKVPIGDIERESETVEYYISDCLKKFKFPTKKEKNIIINKLEDVKNEFANNELTEKRKGIIDDIIIKYKQGYIDSREIFANSDVKNQKFAKHRIMEFIRNKNDNFARVFIDIEGLKTVNDIAGHEKGDIYLLKIYQNMQKTIKDFYNIYPEIKDEIDIIITTEGGDEFGFLIEGKKNGKTKVNEENFSLDRNNKKGKMDLGNMIVDLFNDNLGDIDYEEFITNKDITRGLSEEEAREYKDYEFFASASAGVANMENINWDTNEEFKKIYKRNIEIEEYSEEDAMRKAKFDVFWKEADFLMFREKKEFKNQLRNLNGIVGGEKLSQHIKVLSRNEEHEKLEIKFKELKKQLAELEKENAKLKNNN